MHRAGMSSRSPIRRTTLDAVRHTKGCRHGPRAVASMQPARYVSTGVDYALGTEQRVTNLALPSPFWCGEGRQGRLWSSGKDPQDWYRPVWPLCPSTSGRRRARWREHHRIDSCIHWNLRAGTRSAICARTTEPRHEQGRRVPSHCRCRSAVVLIRAMGPYAKMMKTRIGP